MHFRSLWMLIETLHCTIKSWLCQRRTLIVYYRKKRDYFHRHGHQDWNQYRQLTWVLSLKRKPYRDLLICLFIFQRIWCRNTSVGSRGLDLKRINLLCLTLRWAHDWYFCWILTTKNWCPHRHHWCFVMLKWLNYRVWHLMRFTLALVELYP